jgi:hypothetical protein
VGAFDIGWNTIPVGLERRTSRESHDNACGEEHDDKNNGSSSGPKHPCYAEE